MRLYELSKLISDTDAALCRRPSAEILAHELPRLALILDHVAYAPAACSNPPVGDIDEPCPEEIGARFEQIGAESS